MRSKKVYVRCVLFKCSPALKLAIRDAASADGRSITSWLARAARKWLDRIGPVPRPAWGSVDRSVMWSIDMPGDVMDAVESRGHGSVVAYLRAAAEREIQSMGAGRSSAARA